MIDAFESKVRTAPDEVFLSFVDASGNETRYTYREARLYASYFAIRLTGKGVRRGDCVSVDLPNSPSLVFMALAAAYGSFSLAILNNQMPPAEKMAQLMQLEQRGALRVACRVDQDRADMMLRNAREAFWGAHQRRSALQERNARGVRQRRGIDGASRRVIMGEHQDAREEAIHFAERASRLFCSEELALIVFDSSQTRRLNAIPFTWEQLIGSAEASNAILNRRGRGLWQCALPLWRVAGFQVVVRTIQNHCGLRLYEDFNPSRILYDAAVYGASHVSVTDGMLRGLLEADTRGVLSRYQCILLGGGALNPETLNRALAANARVYASYGLSETASQIASALVENGFDGGMRLLPGYRARIVGADEIGFGRLAVRGPGVFSQYLNGRAAFTADGFFLTDDVAAQAPDGRIYVRCIAC